MRCRICRQATLPGARLCGPCRAALKRARHGGDTDAIGVDDEAATGVGAPRSDAAAVRASSGVSAQRRRWPAVVMLASVLVAAAYVLPRSRLAPGEPHAAVARDPMRAMQPSAVIGASASAPPLRAPLAAMQASATATPERSLDAPQVSSATTPERSRGAMPRRESDPPPRTHVPFARRRGDAQRADQAATARAQAPNPPSLAASAPSPAPVAITEVTRTRWQSMDDAMTACRGGFLERLLCRQKARIAFCDGYWGRVPECATAAATDDTR